MAEQLAMVEEMTARVFVEKIAPPWGAVQPVKVESVTVTLAPDMIAPPWEPAEQFSKVEDAIVTVSPSARTAPPR